MSGGNPELEARLLAAPDVADLRAYADWFAARGEPLMAEMNERLAGESEEAFGAFVTGKLRPTLPSAYAAKIRPSWQPDQLADHGVGKDSLDFRGLHVAKPTKLDWLRQQPFAFHVVKFSLHEGSVEPLAQFPRIASLKLSYSRAEDFSALSSLTKLQELDLWGATVRDLASLAGLRSLVWLTLYRTRVSDLLPLGELTRLRCLSLCDAKNVQDLSPIASLSELRSLNISATNVTDLSPLASLTRLERLYARDLKPTGIETLHRLEGLRHIDLQGSSIATEDVHALSAALPQADIRYSDPA